MKKSAIINIPNRSSEEAVSGEEKRLSLSACTAFPAGVRLDAFLASAFPELSRSRIQKLIADGLVLVNQQKAGHNTRLQGTEEISLLIPEPAKTAIRPENLPLSICYEDRALLVVDKPRGMVVHPANGHADGTLVNALLYHCGAALSGINGELRPGIVHRIDKDTSGLLVVCKNDAAHRGLAQQLKAHTVNRCYEAVVAGCLSADGTVDAPIGRDAANRKKMSTHPKGTSRRAVTHYHILETFAKHTRLECRLETGRTHQIRVHMAAIHHPVTGDLLYGKKDPLFPDVSGQVLHAKTLGFVHPITQEYMEFHSALPAYFEEVLKKLRTKETVV